MAKPSRRSNSASVEVVKVSDGPFQNQSGVVTEIDPERGKLRVSVSIFGAKRSSNSNTADRTR